MLITVESICAFLHAHEVCIANKMFWVCQCKADKRGYHHSSYTASLFKWQTRWLLPLLSCRPLLRNIGNEFASCYHCPRILLMFFLHLSLLLPSMPAVSLPQLLSLHCLLLHLSFSLLFLPSFLLHPFSYISVNKMLRLVSRSGSWHSIEESKRAPEATHFLSTFFLIHISCCNISPNPSNKYINQTIKDKKIMIWNSKEKLIWYLYLTSTYFS